MVDNREKYIDNIQNSEAVNGFILPDGGVGVAQGSNIIPIGGGSSAGTINQDAYISINITSNRSNSAIFVNGENTFKTAPSKIGFRLSEVIRDGIKIITVQSEGYKSLQSYVIRVVSNPDFDVSAFDAYKNTLYDIDGVVNIKPQNDIYSNKSAYVF